MMLSPRFWGKLFALNFAVGVVSGIPMEFQFGTNWSAFSVAGGDVFGHLLGFEAAIAFICMVLMHKFTLNLSRCNKRFDKTIP